MLALARDLISLRKRTDDLSLGRYQTVASPDGVWAWRRGDSVLVVLNMSETSADLEGIWGRIVIGTMRTRDGETVNGVLRLGQWEGLVIEQRGD